MGGPPFGPPLTMVIVCTGEGVRSKLARNWQLITVTPPGSYGDRTAGLLGRLYLDERCICLTLSLVSFGLVDCGRARI